MSPLMRPLGGGRNLEVQMHFWVWVTTQNGETIKMDTFPIDPDTIKARLEHEEENAAFDRALASGRLSHDEDADNYVGDFMFMGPRADGRDVFKHSFTRQYLA